MFSAIAIAFNKSFERVLNYTNVANVHWIQHFFKNFMELIICYSIVVLKRPNNI